MSEENKVSVGPTFAVGYGEGGRICIQVTTGTQEKGHIFAVSPKMARAVAAAILSLVKGVKE